jgi:hypothetical protein
VRATGLLARGEWQEAWGGGGGPCAGGDEAIAVRLRRHGGHRLGSRSRGGVTCIWGLKPPKERRPGTGAARFAGAALPAGLPLAGTAAVSVRVLAEASPAADRTFSWWRCMKRMDKTCVVQQRKVSAIAARIFRIGGTHTLVDSVDAAASLAAGALGSSAACARSIKGSLQTLGEGGSVCTTLVLCIRL